MSTTRRRTALRPQPTTDIHDGSADDVGDEGPMASEDHGHVTVGDHDRRRFADAVRMLRTGGQSLNLTERTLMVVAGIVAPLGLIFVLLGWYGASRTPNLFEQIPYMISGGMFGLGLVFLGAFFYFAHWMTELVKEQRAGSAAVLEALGRLQDSLTTMPALVGHAAGSMEASDDLLLVATARGAMAHRADCAVVEGKDGLRTVTPEHELTPCKMCDPYGPERIELSV